MNKANGTYFAQADACHLPLESGSVDLIMGSPPYLKARLYLENGANLGISRDLTSWIDWMLEVTTEACRVSRGLVLWVCAGCTEDRIYQPGPEGLLYEWVKRGGVAWRPCYWHRVGIPGSGGEHWLRADVEYVLAFKRTADWPEFSDNTANGHPPKWAPGGEMSNRQSDGRRVNQWGHSFDSGGTGGSKDDVTCQPARPSHRVATCTAGPGEWCGTRGCLKCDPWVKHGRGNGVGGRNKDGSIALGTILERTKKPMYRRDKTGARQHTKSRADGTDVVQSYNAPVLANPGTLLNNDPDGPGAYIPEDADYLEPLVSTNVGGGMLGHPYSHENEAPYPVALCEWFIRSHCKPGGTVVDPFSGSGTTIDAAWRLGRKGIGFDLRQSQVEIGTRRMLNPMAKKAKKEVPGESTLFTELSA